MQNEIQEGLKLVAISIALIAVVVLLLINQKLTEKQRKALIIGITSIMAFAIMLCVYIFLKKIILYEKFCKAINQFY